MREPTGGQRAAGLDLTVAANIRAELARRRFRQAQLAQRLGRSSNWLSRRLTGQVAFTLAEVDAIAGFLGMSVSELMADAA